MKAKKWEHEIKELNVEQIIKEEALNIAMNLTEDKDPQFVVLKVENATKIYEIIFGMPADNKRHGIGQTGHLTESQKKIALLKAYNTRKIQIIQNAKRDSNVQYMREHILNKGINSILIGPLVFKHQDFSYLVVIDRVGQSKGWEKHEISYFKTKIKELKHEISQNGLMKSYGHNGSNKQAHVLQHIKDRLGNTAAITGGFAKKLKKLIPEEEDKLQNYLEVIIEEAERIEKEMASWYRLHSALQSEKNEISKKPLSEYLKIFQKKPKKILLSINGNGAITMELPHNILNSVLEIIRAHMLSNSKGKMSITCHNFDGEIAITFSASGFAEYKYNEFELSIAQSLVEEKLQGNFILEKGLCKLVLPQSL